MAKCDDTNSTRLEQFLRGHHLDELPQLWNVLRGDMSLVGPRPERKYFIDQIMAVDPDYRIIFKMRPGLTSEATLYNGYTDTMEKMLRRLHMDIDYYTRSVFVARHGNHGKNCHQHSNWQKNIEYILPNMRKIIAFILLIMLTPVCMSAQSSMTDDQVMQFVVKEHENGTSQQQIVTKLIQKGVDIQQIRRVRKKYENQINGQGLGYVADQAVDEADNRMRKNNSGKKATTKTDGADPDTYSYDRLQKEQPGYSQYYDETDPDFMQMQNELGLILPTDTATMLKQLLAEREQLKRRVFGRDIFNNKNLTFEPSMNIATPQNYHLGPGDAVIIDIYGASQKTINSTVSPDGDVNIEGYGPIQVSGLTIAQANARIRTQLGSRYSSSKVRLTLGQTRTITVNVMGEVQTPGTYTLSAFASVFHALYMAGGTNDIGTLRNIKVFRNNRLVSTVDIYDYILNGKLNGNVRLADGDVISVEPYDCLVNIVGKVKRPMYYEMKKDESLGTLLKYSGSFTGDAYRKSVRVIRKTGREYSVYNVGEFDMNQFRIADGDSVGVDSIMQRFANMVEVKGAVFRPGMYQVGNEITSVRSLINHAEAPERRRIHGTRRNAQDERRPHTRSDKYRH